MVAPSSAGELKYSSGNALCIGSNFRSLGDGGKISFGALSLYSVFRDLGGNTLSLRGKLSLRGGFNIGDALSLRGGASSSLRLLPFSFSCSTSTFDLTRWGRCWLFSPLTSLPHISGRKVSR